MKTVFALTIAIALAAQNTAGGLRIVVIEGEGGVNVIQQKTAVAPVVEVRDRNNQPVAGAVVRFAIQGGRATFGVSNANALSVTTNAAGRAIAAGLTPTASGTVQIAASATFQGQAAATVTIAQTNVMTAAQAAAISSSAGAGGGAGGGAAAGTGGGAGGAAGGAAAGVGASGGASGGLSAAAIAVVGGAGAAAATAVVVLEGGPDHSIAVSPDGSGIRDVTDFLFTAQGLTGDVSWDFGDGTTGTGPTVTHTFRSEGVFQVVAQSSAGPTTNNSVTIGSLTGTWTRLPMTGSSYEQLIITQQGGQLTGQWIHVCTGQPSEPGVNECGVTTAYPLAGVTMSPRAITAEQQGGCSNLFRNGTVSDDLRTMNGTMDIRNPGCVTGPIVPSSPNTLTRQ